MEKKLFQHRFSYHGIGHHLEVFQPAFPEAPFVCIVDDTIVLHVQIDANARWQIQPQTCQGWADIIGDAIESFTL